LHNVPREVWFEWSPVSKAESYTIEIDCEHCCVQGKFCSEVSEARTFRAADLKGTKYRFEWYGDQRGRWRVWASAGFIEGEKSPWRMLSFRTAGTPSPPQAPHIVAPLSNEVVPPEPAEVTFEWEPVVGARSYTLEIDPQNTCAPNKYCSDVGVYRIVENIAGTRYAATFPSQLWTRWRVWAVAGDRTSLKSPWTLFQHTAVAAGLRATPGSDVAPASRSQGPGAGITPEYSDAAKAAGLEGVATVYFEVSPTGATRNAKILEGLGMGLDEKAVELVRSWRFDPGAPPVQAAEIAFRLNAAAGWRVRRAYYKVVQEERNEPDGLKPVLTSYSAPDAAACPAGEHTILEVSFDIGEKGLPDNVHAAASLRDAVLAWRFDPAMVNGKERAAHATFDMECGSANSSPGTTGAPVRPPSILHKIEPEYSQEARQAKYNGSVAVWVMVDADGFPTSSPRRPGS